VTAGGETTSVTIDQAADNGWRKLGAFAFAAGGNQFVNLGDNTGEAGSTNTQLVFDTLRLTPYTDDSASLEDNGNEGGDNEGGDNNTGNDGGGGAMASGGCSTGGNTGANSLVLGLGLALLAARRRHG
jgi:hypothetical protein